MTPFQTSGAGRPVDEHPVERAAHHDSHHRTADRWWFLSCPGGRGPCLPSRCQASSASAAWRTASKASDGSSRPFISSKPRVLTHELETEVTGEDRAPSPRPAGSAGSRGSRWESSTPIDSSESCVQDRRFRLSDPTPPRRHRSRPSSRDVDRRPDVVLEVVDREAAAAAARNRSMSAVARAGAAARRRCRSDRGSEERPRSRAVGFPAERRREREAISFDHMYWSST